MQLTVRNLNKAVVKTSRDLPLIQPIIYKIKGYMCAIHTTARHKYLPGFSDMPMFASLNSSKSTMLYPLQTKTELDLVSSVQFVVHHGGRRHEWGREVESIKNNRDKLTVSDRRVGKKRGPSFGP